MSSRRIREVRKDGNEVAVGTPRRTFLRRLGGFLASTGLVLAGRPSILSALSVEESCWNRCSVETTEWHHENPDATDEEVQEYFEECNENCCQENPELCEDE